MSTQWSLVLFTALTGLAGWMFACIALDEFLGKTKKTAAMASLVAIIVAVVGGIASVTHLAHPENIMNVFGHPTEGIFLEALLVGLMCVFGIIYLILVKRDASAGARKAMAVLAAVFGILLSFFAGKSYMMAAIPAWNSILLPFGYLGTAIPGGVAAYLLIVGAQKEDAEAVKTYGKVLAIAGLVGAILGILYFAAAAPAQMTMGVIVAICGIIAAVAGVMAVRQPEKIMLWAGLALVCAFVGILCFRVAMWGAYDRVIDLFGLVY